MGYYSHSKVTLLNRFDRTASLMREWLRARYGADLAATLRQEIRNEFEQLILNIPYIPGPRARPLNAFLRIAAQELAVYRAMKQYGKPPAVAWELCHEALRRGAASIPQWQRWVMRRFMFSGLAKAIVARRARQQQRGRFGDFEMEYVAGEGDTFHLGINYLQCGILNFVRQHGGEEFAPYICMSDIVLSDALGWGLIRTQTLADGCAYCDFRFKEGTPTQITSRTHAVQRTIEKIHKQDSTVGIYGRT